jgi:aspartate/methionine/tyrosine aminotransferase
VQTPVIPVVADLIRRHPGTISLGQGVVHYGPPPQALAQWDRFLAEPDAHKYKPVQGLPALVEALTTKLHTENRIEPGPDRPVVITAGGNMAFMNALLAIGDPGDEVILQTPYYFNHEMAVTMASCRPVLVPTDANYQLQPDAIAAALTPRTRAVVTISPNNPTGAVYPEAALRAVNELCLRHGVYHIHDEAYEYFTWGDTAHFSPGALPEAGAHTISLFSMSKAYGFASWRVGWMVVPDHLMTAVRKIQDTIVICAPAVSQYAALGALEAGPGYCRTQLAVTRETREHMLHELARLGPAVTVPPAQGAFYFLLRIDTPRDAMELVEALIVRHGVAVIPGTAFGLEDGCSLRVAYGALRPDTATEAVARLVRGLRTELKL